MNAQIVGKTITFSGKRIRITKCTPIPQKKDGSGRPTDFPVWHIEGVYLPTEPIQPRRPKVRAGRDNTSFLERYPLDRPVVAILPLQAAKERSQYLSTLAFATGVMTSIEPHPQTIGPAMAENLGLAHLGRLLARKREIEAKIRAIDAQIRALLFPKKK